MGLLEVRHIDKSFGQKRALADVGFEIEAAEILCVLGPSGCGKTTLLRAIAGLERPDRGELRFAGADITSTAPHQRGFGLMFQDYALFPHKNVLDNVAFGLRMAGLSPAEVQRRAQEALALVDLTDYARRDVHSLSGGEQQRVALARSLAPKPRLLMLDEPLGSLDRPLRERLMNELRPLLKRIGITTLYVTHDQEEAFAVADRLIIMHQGRLVQEGQPAEVYQNPNSPFVAHFLGLTNLLPAHLSADRPGLWVETPWGLFNLGPRSTPPPEAGDELTLLIRPEAAQILTSPGGGENLIEVIVQECSFRGDHYRLIVNGAHGPTLTFHIGAQAKGLPQPGERIKLSLRAEHMSWLAGGPGEA